MPDLLSSIFGFPDSDRNAFMENPALGDAASVGGVRGVVAWSWEIPTNRVTYSQEWRNLLLRPDDDNVQTALESWWPLVHEDDVQPFLEASRDIVEGVTEEYQTLFRIRRADGEWAWLLSRGRVTEKEGSRPVRVCGMLVDITFLRSDIKFLHGHASMSAPRFHVLPESDKPAKADEVWETASHHGKFKSVRYFSAETGIISEPGAPTEKKTPEMQALVHDCVERVFRKGLAMRKMMTFPTVYGHNVTGEYLFWPEFDETGKVAAVMTQFWDLTETILAERRVRLNEKRLHALYRLTQMTDAPENELMGFVLKSLVEFTESQSGVLFFPQQNPRRNGRMVWTKNHCKTINTESLVNNAVPEELLALARDEEGHCTPIIRNGNCLQPVASLFKGELQIMRYITAPVFDGSKLVCIAGVSNKQNTEYREDDLLQLQAFINSAWLILRRHDDIRELQRAKEAAEKANKVKDEFLANVSHELRTPLNGMLSMLQLLNFLPLSEQQREYVRTAASSGKALLRIISDILDFARIESGKMRLQVEPFEFKSAFESSLDLFRSNAEERGLKFEAIFDERIPKTLLGDDARVRQVIYNIVGNSLKFTDHGGIRVECSLLPYDRDDQTWVYLAVHDTGIGIAPEEQEKIFDPFTQIDSSTTRKYKGTGLGLSIVRHLVGLMDGSLTIESELGKGTTVHCSLRFSHAPEDGKDADCGMPVTEGPGVNSLNILVAEDDDISRLALLKFLQHLGYNPVCVRNGRLALEMLQLHPFHCLFTDIQMPEMDGLEVVRRIRDNDLDDITPSGEAREALGKVVPGTHETSRPVPRDTVVVTVSAHTMRGDRERFLDAGMDFYLSKPIIIKELEDVLRKIAARVAE
ncbi:MAG: Sensor histidine kinase RcsC [Desulfovibrio sp.]